VANFVVTLDPDPARRLQFVDTITPRLSLVEGLLQSSCATGDFCAAWAIEPRAPVSCRSDRSGAAVLWGEAIAQPRGERISAEQLRGVWDPARVGAPAVFDGFHAAIVYESRSGFVLGTDPLGLFPVYYWSDGEVTLAGSSPELFRYHPRFQARFDPAGLVGILLTNSLVDGRTLWQDVHRLGAGHVLLWRPGNRPREVPGYAIPVSCGDFDLPLSGHARLLANALDESLAQHVPQGSRIGLLLSGGLDSRVLAGLLHRRGVSPVALTFGRRGDLEMDCAAGVARALGFEHSAFSDQDHELLDGANLLADGAERKATWEHLANGFGTCSSYSSRIRELRRRLPSPVLSGYVMDAAVGGSHIAWGYSERDGAMSFATLFSRVNALGLAPSVLVRLLRQDVFGSLVTDTIRRLQELYAGYADLDSRRAWCFDLRHRQRFFIGGTAWQLSFTAWPVLPATNRRVLETAARIPAGALAERAAEIQLLRQEFPNLAALPLDRNSYDTTPLIPRPRALIVQALRRRLSPSRFIAGPKRERRYYYRLFDINGPGWIAVRERADGYRSRVADLLHLDVLDEVLPGPGARPAFEDPIIQSSGLKLLLAFLIWSKDHL
jgi:asparagine synthase (glutamine-hydrolysing)